MVIGRKKSCNRKKECKLYNDCSLCVYLEAFIVPKVDFNKTNKDDKIMNNLQTLPFESFDKIISLSEGGYISKDKLEIYLSIKKEFALVVSMKITFFDIDKAQGLW